MEATEVLELTDSARRAWSGNAARPVRVHLWRPAKLTDRTPLVLLSHGTGGAAVDLAWLAGALAEAGILAAGIDHHGHNYVDGYHAEAFAAWWDRPRDLSFALDHISATMTQGRVGAGGFSIGGYTAAALLGARVADDAYAALLSGEIEAPPTPEYPGLDAELRERIPPEQLQAWVTESAADHTDSRIDAAFLLAPSLGPLLDEASLSAIKQPVAVWWADADATAPPATNAHRYSAAIPTATGYSAGADTGHYTFVNDDTQDTPTRDRVAAAAAAFFDRHLRRPAH
ncbi:hypothetical protein EJ357_47415 [Streptomyces cyaneochromogenes]|uniref:Serine aminopeptidase S33 domain-containing protein n=1 Tax=Streptomyces cyaneochromogenes TaxID=2496836 RepID=A0A3Q9F0U5_9ACTN|nr:alpha/beta hydrolase [Streptomyces cyaneochromogenes]AZQ40073.1 hypothetical protein EJ357_47415 [Streptomyces cyaneochromogenes]